MHVAGRGTLLEYMEEGKINLAEKGVLKGMYVDLGIGERPGEERWES